MRPASPSRAPSRRAVIGAAGAWLTLAACGDPRGRDYATGPVTLATGGTRGVYYAFGTGIAAVAAADLPDAPLEVVSTSGSVENLRLAATGADVLAFSAMDAAGDAVLGEGSFSEALPLAALARVYDDYLHVICRASSGMTGLGDLRGRTVSLGSNGSGTELIARRLLEVVGIDTELDLDVRDLGIDASIEALAAGSLDAFFWSGGLPTAGVADLARSVPVRLLPVEDPVARLRERFSSAYRAAVVPADVYSQGRQVPTLAVPNLLLCREDTDAGLVHELTRLLFVRRRAISATVPLAGALDRRSAIFTTPVPLHPGALEFYRETAG